jgi:hypothetical protein
VTFGSVDRRSIQLSYGRPDREGSDRLGLGVGQRLGSPARRATAAWPSIGRRSIAPTRATWPGTWTGARTTSCSAASRHSRWTRLALSPFTRTLRGPSRHAGSGARPDRVGATSWPPTPAHHDDPHDLRRQVRRTPVDRRLARPAHPGRGGPAAGGLAQDGLDVLDLPLREACWDSNSSSGIRPQAGRARPGARAQRRRPCLRLRVWRLRAGWRCGDGSGSTAGGGAGSAAPAVAVAGIGASRQKQSCWPSVHRLVVIQ